MAAQTWSVNIIAGSPAQFVPDVYVPPGTPETGALQAQIGDQVSWNNQTDDEHHIWLTNAQYEPQSVITDPIGPWKSSYPGYVTQQADVTPPVAPDTAQVIYYYCSIHNDEHGQINIVS